MKNFKVTVQVWDGFSVERRELLVKARDMAGVERALNRRKWDDWQIISVNGA